MKKINLLVVVLSIVLIATGLAGASSAYDYGNMMNGTNSYGNMMNGTNSYGNMMNGTNSYGNMMGGTNHYGNMMNGYNRYSIENDGEKIAIDILEENVNEYLSNYSEKLKIEDIFVYDDSEYYFSIVEEETGHGAMELLVNPYSGYVYPEYGPNMMWNLKYGMHNNAGTMMGRGHMMGIYNYNTIDYDVENEISLEEAYNKGSDYLLNSDFENVELSNDVHEFYGYYTFHLEKEDITVGMLSVNAYTGDVWFHNWHGNLVEMIDSHTEE